LAHHPVSDLKNALFQELHDVPFYYELPEFFHVLKSPVLRVVDFRSAILNAGYRCSISHANAKSIKTDAPLDFIWDIVRTHVWLIKKFCYKIWQTIFVAIMDQGQKSTTKFLK
jgi:tRNA G26 N,N-dimethylase Trm1